MSTDQQNLFLSAIVTLQSQTESIEEKILALRYLKHYVETNSEIDAYNRKRINQLIVDNVMKIIIHSANQVNGFRRQLVRVELFVLLSQILRSSSLFGAELTQSVIHEIRQFTANGSSLIHDSDRNPFPPSSSGSYMAEEGTEELMRFPAQRSTSSMTSRNAFSKEQPGKAIILFDHNNNNNKRPKTGYEKLHPVESLQLFSKSTKGLSTSASLSTLPESNLIKQTLSERKPKVELRSKLKPRPSVLFDDKLGSDHFVPGTDPKNFIEQDRKLGYQKPRMWFPVPQLELMSSISQNRKTDENPVVEEYLKMKSLASYVGDLILPPNSSYASTKTKGSAIALSPLKGVQSSVVDAKRYSQALKEAMMMWTPILNAHKPNQGFGKKRKISFISDDPSFQNDINDILPHPSSSSTNAAQLRSPPPRLFYEASVPYEPFHVYQQDYSNRDVSRSILEYNQYQRDFSSSLTKQNQKIFHDLQLIQNRMNSLVNQEYQSFHRKYLLLLEGNENKSRHLLLKLTKFYLKHKRKNLLSLAFGLWKIENVEAKSLERRPQYSRVASCYLMAAWYQRIALKNLRLWVQRWRKRIVWMIFLDRNKAVLKIQSLYRQRRDCKKMFAKHNAAPFLGILSDIELAPERSYLPFRIPKQIRKERRMYWLAATKIQSLFRCWIACRDYFKRKRQLILLQSIFRMWPIFKWYRRLRATTIKCQAWARRTVKRKQYKRMRKAAIIIQKYVRRYLAILLRQRMFDQKNYEIEIRLYAAIKIQCRYRIRLAKRVLKRLKFQVKLIEYSALVIQRNWYRYKGAFHTFLLMCCLRVREHEDLALEDLATQMGRKQLARRIKRAYAMRYFKRNIESVIKVQCWFRGRLGYNLVSILRRERWASRKLRHWARCRLRKRNVMARRIQRWWWKLKRFRLLRHLWTVAKNRDYSTRKRRAEEKYQAACKIQALVRGIWDRRWVRRHRAALLIQKNLKFFFGLKKWKMMKREKNLKTVRKFVNKCIDQALQNQTIRIVQFHNTIIRKVQALVRRFLVRCVFMKSQKRAYQVGLAVVKIQRSWRKSGEISKAVEEVLARKRAESNPFKDCFFFHDLLMILRKECKPYYYPYDPRVGMKISTFLYRLGMIEIMDLFPKRNYVYALDLQKITLEKLNEMYTLTQNRPTRKNEKRKQLPLILQPNGANGGGGGGKKKTGPPTALFQLLLEILNITAGTRKPNSLQKLRFYLLPITDYMTANEAFIQIRKLYLKKFGKHVQTRATNVSRDIVEMCYNNYHHYQINNTLIPSLGFLQYIINLTQENTNVIPNLQEMQQFYQQHYLQDEKKWELERMKHSAQLLQLAVDRSLEILPKRSFIRNQIDVVLNRVITYKRKAAYILKKLQEEAAALAASNKKSGKGKNKSTIGKKPRSPGSNGTSTGQIEQKKRSPKASDNSNKLNQDDSLEVLQSEILPAAQIHLKRHPEDLIIDTNAMVYDGDDLTDYELDFQYNLTKSYGAVLFRMYRLTMGIQSIKNHWSNQALHRAMILEKRNQFLESMTQKYIEEQAENHVYKLWLKMRKLEIAAKKTENIIQAIRERKEWIEEQLQYVLRYHIGMYQDDFGYYYYVDEWYNSSYDPPLYSYEQWINVEKIQRRAKKYIVGARARRIAKEEEERRIIALQEALMLEERKQSLKAITARIFVKSFAAMMVEKMFLRRPNRGRPTSTLTSRRQRRPGSVLGGTATRLLEDDVKENLLVSEDPLYQNILSQIDLTTIDEHLDAMIPHKYRFDYTIHPKSGIWGLYYTPTNKEPILGQKIGTYQVVILFKIRKQEGLCDIRTVKGNIINNVSLKRIRHVQYSIGTKVECRYKYRKLFYRAVIIKIHDRRHLSGYENQFVTYSVRYEDGEVEHKLQRDAIRPVASSTEEFKKWHDEREFHLQTARRIYRRKMFFKLQKQQRMKDLIELHSHSFAMMDAKTLSPPSTSTALIPLNEDNTEGTVENSHPEVEEMFSTPLKGSADDEGMPTATSPEVTGHEIDNENHSHQSESTVSPTQLEKRLVTISPSSMPIAVSGSNSKVVIPVVRVRIKYTRQTPRYPWQIISQPQTRAQREENYPTVFFNPHTEEESEDMDQTLYAAKELHVIKKIQMRWLVFRAIKKLQRKTMSMDLRSIIVNTIEKGRKIAYVGYKLEGLTPMQILARAGYFELAEIITDYYQKVLQKTMSNLTIEEIAVNMVTKELYEKHLGILQTNHVRDLKEFQTWWKKTSPFERESKLGLFNYYTSTRDPRSLKQCINDSLELFVKKFSKYLKTSSTKTKKSCQMIIEASDFPHSHLQVETYLRRYSDKPELAREFVMELVNKPTVNTYVDEGKVLKMYYHVALQVSKILAVYKLKNVRAIVLDALRRVEEIMKDIVKINQRYNSSSGTGEEALPLTTATGDRVKGRPMHSGPEAKAAWIIREEIFQYLLILIQATTRIQCRWKAYSYRQRWKLFLTSRIAAIDKIQRCVRRYSAYKIARYYRGQRDSPWEQLWNSQYNLLYYYNFVTGQSQYFEPTTDLYRPLIRDKRSAQLIQAWPELDDIRSMIYQEMMQARAPYEKGNAGSKSYYKSKHTLPVMSKTVAQDLGMLAEIPANLLCIICQTRRVIRYCLNCSYDMITLMNKTRKTASSPSRGNRLSSASLTSSDGRRSSLSAGSSRHGGHEYMMPSSLGRFQKPVPYCLPCFLKEHHEDDEEKFNHKFLLAVNTLPPVEGGTTAVIPLPSATSPGRAASPQPLLLEDGSSLEGSLEEQSSDITIPITMTAMVPYGGKPSTANSTASSVVAAAATSLLPHSNLLYLKCCMCDRPATRKCQGLLHDEDINSLLAQLKKCPKSEWKKVIKPFTSLTSEKKLLLLIEQIIQQDDSEEVTTDLHDDSSHHSDPYRVKAGGDNHSVHSRDTTSSSYYNTLSPNQLQQIKYALEKLRHECDECYCTSCYQIVHSGGKRQYHTWKGFQEYARVCSVCQANPSELSCLDCISAVTQHLPPSMDSTKAANQLLGNHLNDNGMMMSVRDNKRGVDYCTACFHVYHTIGRKKRHRKEVVYEKYANDPNYYFDGLDMIKEEDEQGEITLNQDIPADDYCTLCLRRLGKKCQHDECQTIVCDECFEFKHKKRCKHRPHTLVTQGGSSRKLTLSPSSRNLYGGDGDVKADQGMSKSMGAKNSKKIGDKTVEEQICVVCGEIADKKCVQCGDFYCSRVWMGNPGCFIQYHSKGNRATHQTQSLSEANQKTFISFSSLLEQGKLNIKPGKSFNLNN